MSSVQLNFPFSAIVAQERLKLSLLLNAVNPSIGGLLVRGPKGSGKSVGVRALGDLLPEVEVVADCSFNCSPRDPSNMCSSCRLRFEAGENLPVKKKKMRVITLPLGSTEDRVVGTLDMAKALREGVVALQPGILAEANQNILYVDEINLLPDHIVDDLLDAAASGWNLVERESISLAHPSRFILVGTMNPEEGELRPQLLDRLPISVTLQTVMNVDDRVEIVKKNLEFKENPSAFIKKYSSEQDKLREKILKAKETLKKVRIHDSVIYMASSICADLEVDGQRPDIIITETARTIAALNGRSNITSQDVLEATKLALNHRTRKGGFEGPATEKQIEEAYRKTSLSIRIEALAPASEEKAVSEGSLFPPQQKETGQSASVKSTDTLLKPDTTKVREDIIKLKEETDSKKISGRFILFGILKGLISIGLFIGSGIYFHVDIMTPLGLAYLFLFVPIIALFLLRRKVPLILKTQNLLVGKIKIKGFISRKSELFKGAPLGEKIKGWIDNRSRILPDVTVRSSRRSFFAGKRGISLTTLTRGRYRSYEKPPKLTGDIALFPTIQAASVNRHINRGGIPLISVQPEDVRTKVRVYRAPVTVVLVLDVSGSMAERVNDMAKAVSILNREAYRKRDRLALIAFKGQEAHVLNDPTTNINVVTGNIKRLRASWSTPLADGMMKAVEVVENERKRNKAVIPLVAIISDFLPNIPLKMPGHTDGLADTLYVAKILKRNRIPAVVINTYPTRTEPPIFWGGTMLGREIARIAGGKYYETSLIRGSIGTLEEIISENISDEFLAASQSPIRMRGF